MSELLKLAERCERAGGPDRNLDYAIHNALREKPKRYHTADYKPRNAKAVTASIDAAMTLVPVGCGIALERYWLGSREEPVWWAKLRWGINGEGVDAMDIASPALALCAAALRARAASPSPNALPQPLEDVG